jgi:ubiquinone/menaquinone biosynthesis C-methylase UbiE
MSSKAYFDDIAQQWDSIRSEFFSENVREAALNSAGVRAGEIAGDIGAGSGFVTEALLRRGLKVIAVDQSPAMLDALTARFPCAEVETRVGEAEALPLKDASLDYAFANMFLHHVERPAETIREMVRTLKPGGKLVITDVDEHTHEFLRTEQHDRWLGFKREDVAAWFKEAGLVNVRVGGIEGETCSSQSTYTYESANITIFLAYGEKSR